jgi:alkaline phosphatase D
MYKYFLFLFVFCFIQFSFGQKTQRTLKIIEPDSVISSGPMLGYAALREACIWVRTKKENEVMLNYRIFGKDTSYTTLIQNANNFNQNCLKFIAKNLEPGTTYEYFFSSKEGKINFKDTLRFKTPPLWQYRTDPPSVKIALGSCSYFNETKYDRPGKPYGASREIFNTIANKKPDIMFWLGDNTYLREVDFDSKSGILHRFTRDKAWEELRDIFKTSINLAIWDDHDYGPNNSDRSYVLKDETCRTFQNFWGNPPSHFTEKGEGISTEYSYADVDFFMLDNRWFRTASSRKTGVRTILGMEQRNYLIDALLASNATFKFVAIGGQVLNDAAVDETYISVAPEERNWLLNEIKENNIKNVIFLTGDRHHTELSKWQDAGATIYDWTVSPFTSGVHKAPNEPNSLRVPGSYIETNNFGVIEITGARKERVANLNIFDSKGVLLWNISIPSEKK